MSDEGKKMQLELEQLREKDAQKGLDMQYQHKEIMAEVAKIEEMTDQLVHENCELAESDNKLAILQKALRAAPIEELAKKDAELDVKDGLLDQKNSDIESLLN